MQKIIAGTLRGRKLLELPRAITGVRPTSGLIRSAIFDRLQQDIVDAHVLDLFAGSGAVALEAISRGARQATAVELQPAVQRFLARQIETLGMQDRVHVWKGDAREFIARAPGTRAYDIVYCDPPYADAALYGPVLELLAASSLLAEDAHVIVEWSSRSAAACAWPAGWVEQKRRRYGESELIFLLATSGR